MSNSRQVLISEKQDDSLFVIMEHHIADLWIDEEGNTQDEGYEIYTLEVFDLTTGQLVISEKGDLEEMKQIMEELKAEAVA